MDDLKAQNDAYLIGLSQKNPEAFGVLMNRYEGPLFHYIRRIGQFTTEDTEDLLQEVFIKIYRKLNEYNDDLRFSSWAYRIAHNHVIDYFRKSSARPRSMQIENDEWEKIVSGALSVDKKIILKDCVEKIRLAISELPIGYREILMLRFLEEKDYLEIMDILKKPKGTVATLIARGKKELEKKLKEKNINCY